MTTPAVFEYGAYEIRSQYQVFALQALGIAVAIHLAVIGGFNFIEAVTPSEPPRIIICTLRPTDLPPPPSILNSAAAPAIHVASTVSGGSRANPIMVPDAEISPENTIATQAEMNPGASTSNLPGENGGTIVVNIGSGIDSETEPPPFLPVEKSPTPIVSPGPVYPLIALKAGIEGTVHTRVWVTKEGKVKKVEVVKSDSDILTEAAVSAAAQWVFTPAIMNNGPVAVWVAIPFKFSIQRGL